MIQSNRYSQSRPTHLANWESLTEVSPQTCAYDRESREQVYARHCHTESVMLRWHPDNEMNTFFCRDDSGDQDTL